MALGGLKAWHAQQDNRAELSGPRRVAPPPRERVGDDASRRDNCIGPVVSKRRAVAEAHYYPRSICPLCFSDKTEGRSLGQGYDLFLQRHTPRGGALRHGLREGPRVATNIADCDFDKLRCEQAAKVVFKPTDGGPPLPMFTT